MALKKLQLPNNTTVDINDSRNVVIGNGINNVVSLTNAQYTALSTKDANTLYVITDVAPSSYAPLTSPALTGTPTAPTATYGTDTTQIATTAFVQSAQEVKRLCYQAADAGEPTDAELQDCYADSVALINAGKIPILEITDVDGYLFEYYLYTYEQNEALTFIHDSGNSLTKLIIDSDDNVGVYNLNLEQTSNKVTSISSTSTNTQYPSAKCIYDLIGDVETLLAAL